MRFPTSIGVAALAVLLLAGEMSFAAPKRSSDRNASGGKSSSARSSSGNRSSGFNRQSSDSRRSGSPSAGSRDAAKQRSPSGTSKFSSPQNKFGSPQPKILRAPKLETPVPRTGASGNRSNDDRVNRDREVRDRNDRDRNAFSRDDRQRYDRDRTYRGYRGGDVDRWRYGQGRNRGYNGGNRYYFGSPWYGLGGVGLWGGWGYGYPAYGVRRYTYGYPYAAGYTTTYSAAVPATVPVQEPVAPPEQPVDPTAAADFADQGEADFKAGNYEAAMRDWRHALVDDPENGMIVMLLAQTLFALGQYDEAAGATQGAMQMLPEDRWGFVVENYTELYGNVQDYTNQVKALEKARDEQPDSPALRFLLGFQFGYLGYPKHAVRELDKGLTLAPEDIGAQKLRAIFAAKWPEAPPLPAAAAEAARQFEQQSQQPPGGAAPGPAGAAPDDKPAPEPPKPADAPPSTPS